MAKLLRILASELGCAGVAHDVAQLLRDRPYQFLQPAALDAASGGCDLAFVSRDVTGLSTKHEVQPATQQFYQAMLASTDLRWVHVHSSGIDRPIYTDLQARGVRVTGSVGANATVVAQTALAGILSLARRFPLLMQAQLAARWQPLHGQLMPRDLSGQHLTIVGWGAIGQQLAAYGQMLGMKITVARHSGQAIGGDIQTLSLADLQRALPHTDWLALACPLTEQTRGLIGVPQLAALPAGAHVINVSRGDVIDEQALIAALQSGHLGGAFLDVFAHEPLPPTSVLWNLPQVIATPHCAGFSDGNEKRVAQMFIDNLQRWLRGTL